MPHGVTMPHGVAMPCTVTPPGGDGAPRGDGASQGDNALRISDVPRGDDAPWGDDAPRGDDALQISDAPWDDDASQGGIPMGAAMPLRTRARGLIQAHPSIQQLRVPVSPRSRLSPPRQDRASSAPGAGTAGCQVAVAVQLPCGSQVSPGTNAAGDLPAPGWPAPNLPCAPAGASLRHPQPHPGAPSHHGDTVAQGKVLPLGLPVFLGVIQHLFNSARGTTRGLEVRGRGRPRCGTGGRVKGAGPGAVGAGASRGSGQRGGAMQGGTFLVLGKEKS